MPNEMPEVKVDMQVLNRMNVLYTWPLVLSSLSFHSDTKPVEDDQESVKRRRT
jgi:hypothetical protein